MEAKEELLDQVTKKAYRLQLDVTRLGAMREWVMGNGPLLLLLAPIAASMVSLARFLAGFSGRDSYPWMLFLIAVSYEAAWLFKILVERQLSYAMEAKVLERRDAERQFEELRRLNLQA